MTLEHLHLRCNYSKITSFLPVLFLFFTNCSQKPIDYIQIDYNAVRQEISFDAVYLVPLETKEELMLGSELRFNFDSTSIYCLDYTNLHSIARFNRQGKFLNRIGKRGKGPEEYTTIIDFCLNKDTLIVNASAGEDGTFCSYLNNGKFIAKRKSGISPISIEKVHNGMAMYVSYNKHLYDHRIILCDDKLIPHQKFLPNDNALDIPMDEDNFQKSTTAVTFIEAFNNSGFIIQDDRLIKTYEFDFGKYAIPKSFYRTPPLQGLDKIDKRGFANIKSYFESTKYSTFLITHQKKNTNPLISIVTHNKLTGITQKLGPFEDNENIFSNLIYVTAKNELVFLIHPLAIMHNKSIIDELNIENPEVLNNLMEMDNPVLAFCKITD